MFDSLVDAVSSSNWTYLLLFAFAFGDVLFPLIPSETAVITAGVLAATGELSLGLIIVCAAAGAILGDNTAYLIGYIGGAAFEESPVKAILLAFGIAFGIAATIEGVRWWRRRQARAEQGAVPREPLSGEDGG